MSSRTKKQPHQLLKWTIENNMLNEWHYLDEEVPRNKTYGCVFNTLTFLNVIPRDVGEYLTKLSNAKVIKEGTTPEDFYQLMHEYYNETDDNKYHFSLVEYPLSPDTWDMISQHLSPSEGTFLWLHRDLGETGHAVVLAKTDSGELVIVDPQQGKLRMYADFEHWFMRIGITRLLFVVKTRTNKRTYRKTKRTRTPSIEKPKSKRMREYVATFSHADIAQCNRQNSKTRSRSKSRTKRTNPSLTPDELCIVILSHGSYMNVNEESNALMTKDGQAENVSFSRFPIFDAHEGIHNMDIPETHSFQTPSNVMLYQYTNPEIVLYGAHVDYIFNHIDTGKCPVPNIPSTYSIYVKKVPSDTPPSNDRKTNNLKHTRSTSPDIQILTIPTKSAITMPKTNTSNLKLVFDTSVHGYIMGYTATDHDGNTDSFPMDMTYTSLRNVLYDLSAKYPTKKLYVHQLSCRAGTYTDYKENLAELNSLVKTYHESDEPHHERIAELLQKIYHETEQEKHDSIEMQVDELVRDFSDIGFKETLFTKYTKTKHEQLIQNKYELASVVLDSQFSNAMLQTLQRKYRK
jgi:hypothetical protein